MSTVVTVVPSAGHDRPDHVESVGRMRAILALLEQKAVLSGLVSVEPVSASEKQLRHVHSPEMIQLIHRASAGGATHLDADTYLTPASYEAGRLAAGSSMAVVDQIMAGTADSGFALIRPPGHHAESQRPGGFCLFNNVALAARHAQVAHGIERVMIVDIDVHHGNGTQEIFYEDGSVLFVSTHLYGRYFYPGTGSAEETGFGAGVGQTLNIPLPSRVGDVGYERIFQELMRPKGIGFQPNLILVSVGFDAHWRDPLAYGGLTLRGYAQLAQNLIGLAEELCQGRILFVLEGGYLHQALAYGVLNLLYALSGQDQIEDPLGPMPESETSVTNLLFQLRQLHLIN